MLTFSLRFSLRGTSTATVFEVMVLVVAFPSSFSVISFLVSATQVVPRTLAHTTRGPMTCVIRLRVVSMMPQTLPRPRANWLSMGQACARLE